LLSRAARLVVDPGLHLAASLWTPVGGVVDLRAEAFTGQALAGLGGGVGIDDPDDEDLDASSRLRNTAFEGHVAWRHAPAVAGLELRRLQTDYAPPANNRSATHMNLAVGFEF
jgi:hypothetical protein